MPRLKQRPADDVDAYMAQLDHPRKAEIETLRSLIKAVDPRIRESVKWNAPSFALADHFATLKLRPFETVQVVLHTGAKLKPNAAPLTIADPAGLLQWAAPDRAVATFAGAEDLAARGEAFAAIVRAWIAQL